MAGHPRAPRPAPPAPPGPPGWSRAPPRRGRRMRRRRRRARRARLPHGGGKGARSGRSGVSVRGERWGREGGRFSELGTVPQREKLRVGRDTHLRRCAGLAVPRPCPGGGSQSSERRRRAVPQPLPAPQRGQPQRRSHLPGPEARADSSARHFLRHRLFLHVGTQAAQEGRERSFSRALHTARPSPGRARSAVITCQEHFLRVEGLSARASLRAPLSALRDSGAVPELPVKQ